MQGVGEAPSANPSEALQLFKSITGPRGEWQGTAIGLSHLPGRGGWPETVSPATESEHPKWRVQGRGTVSR